MTTWVLVLTVYVGGVVEVPVVKTIPGYASRQECEAAIRGIVNRGGSRYEARCEQGATIR